MSTTDWDALVGPRLTPSTVYEKLAEVPEKGYSAGKVITLKGMEWEVPVAEDALHAMFSITDSVILTKWKIGHGNDSFIAMAFTNALVPLVGMERLEVNGGVLESTSCSLTNVDLQSYIDGLWPGDGLHVGNATLIQLSRLQGPYITPYTGFLLKPSNIPATIIGEAGTTGEALSHANLEEIVVVAEGTHYAAGTLITESNRANLYQVSTAGTCGGGVVSGHPWWQYWPGGPYGGAATQFCRLPPEATSQPFADGPDTLKLVWIGPDMHADGIQIARAGIIDTYRSKIAGFQNSCLFIESAAESYDKSQYPVGPVRVRECDLEAGLNAWLYINTNTTDPTYGSPTGGGSLMGRWVRNKVTGVWTACATPWWGRPEMVTVVNNLFRDRYSDGLHPTMGLGETNGAVHDHLNPSLGNGGAEPVKGDFPAYVPSEAVRQAGILNQTRTNGEIKTNVLEERFQAGLFPGAVDARSWIVWDGNYDQRGVTIYPNRHVSVGQFDAHGFYVGP